MQCDVCFIESYGCDGYEILNDRDVIGMEGYNESRRMYDWCYLVSGHFDLFREGIVLMVLTVLIVLIF